VLLIISTTTAGCMVPLFDMQDDLVARVNRSFTLLMDAGLFDPVTVQSYTKIPFETINSDAAQWSNLEVGSAFSHPTPCLFPFLGLHHFSFLD
jgi:hypothetical protein